MPVLGICIPTYNRKDLVIPLLETILAAKDLPIEVCVHDDGSTDGTHEALCLLAGKDDRLRVSTGANSGRAAAVLAATGNATARFLMLFDDDDIINMENLRAAVARCEEGVPPGVAGFIYQMDFESGKQWERFPIERSNFLALRADYRVIGDKKEIVLGSLLKAAAPSGAFRRSPTSLSWARIAQAHDAICVNLPLGTKRYLAGGLSSDITKIKRVNAPPMAMLYLEHIKGFARRRYSSPRFFGKAVLGLFFYGLIAALRYRPSRTRPAQA